MFFLHVDMMIFVLAVNTIVYVLSWFMKECKSTYGHHNSLQSLELDTKCFICQLGPLSLSIKQMIIC